MCWYWQVNFDLLPTGGQGQTTDKTRLSTSGSVCVCVCARVCACMRVCMCVGERGVREKEREREYSIDNIERRDSSCFFLRNLLIVPRRLQHVHVYINNCAVQECTVVKTCGTKSSVMLFERTAQRLLLTELKSLGWLVCMLKPLADEGWEATGVPGEKPLQKFQKIVCVCVCARM